MMKTGRIAGLALAAALLAAMAARAAAAAEVDEVRFARMQGLGYLQIYLLQDLKLVEKHAAALGHPVTAVYTALGQPTAVNDALLSGSADF